MSDIKEVMTVIIIERGIKKEVPAIEHVDCDGLCVTMGSFGFFVVTHCSTGLKMCDLYERASTAMLVLSQFELIAREYNFSWAGKTRGQIAETMKEIEGYDVPFKAFVTSGSDERKQTVKEWISCLRAGNLHGYVDEFPWEETDNWEMAMENLER